jgi:hypothetical protein
MPGKSSTELKEQSGFQYLHRARNGKWDCYLSYEWYLSIPKVGSNQYLLPFLLAELEKGQTRYHPVHSRNGGTLIASLLHGSTAFDKIVYGDIPIA